MSKTTVVVFTKEGARILVNPEKALYEKEASYVVNPDLSALAGIPPHRWALEGDRIVAAHPEKGIVVAVPKDVTVVKAPKKFPWVTLILILHTLTLGAVTYLLLTR